MHHRSLVGGRHNFGASWMYLRRVERGSQTSCRAAAGQAYLRQLAAAKGSWLYVALPSARPSACHDPRRGKEWWAGNTCAVLVLQVTSNAGCRRRHSGTSSSSPSCSWAQLQHSAIQYSWPRLLVCRCASSALSRSGGGSRTEAQRAVTSERRGAHQLDSRRVEQEQFAVAGLLRLSYLMGCGSREGRPKGGR